MYGRLRLSLFLFVASLLLSQIYGEEPCSGWFQNIENGHCYMKFCDEKTFEDAQSVCKGLGGHLPYIQTEYEDKFVATLTRAEHEHVAAHYWIGIWQKNGKWVYVNGKEARYFNWQGGEPNNLGGREQCVHYAMMWGDWTQWNDLRCGLTCRYICERDSCKNLPLL